MTAQELREKLLCAYHDRALDDRPAMAEALITIICEQRQALEIAALGETQFDGVEAMHAARKALADTDKRLAKMGAL